MQWPLRWPLSLIPLRMRNISGARGMSDTNCEYCKVGSVCHIIHVSCYASCQSGVSGHLKLIFTEHETIGLGVRSVQRSQTCLTPTRFVYACWKSAIQWASLMAVCYICFSFIFWVINQAFTRLNSFTFCHFHAFYAGLFGFWSLLKTVRWSIIAKLIDNLLESGLIGNHTYFIFFFY